MAQLTFNIPDQALARLDAYAQENRFVDWHDFVVFWMKTQFKQIKKRDNRDQANDLLQLEPNLPNIS